MAEFVRARSAEQKEMRMNEIKKAADGLFACKPYHEITLTTIAAQLSWTRANVYQYVTSKEEIFLDICADKMKAYMNALLSAFPEDCGYSVAVYAEVWAGILWAHKEYLRYGDILPTIIETNVSVERLARFKALYYELAGKLAARLAGNLSITAEDAGRCVLSVYFHAVGMCGVCAVGPLVQEALAKAGIAAEPVNFKEEMKEFIIMNLTYCQARRQAD